MRSIARESDTKREKLEKGLVPVTAAAERVIILKRDLQICATVVGVLRFCGYRGWVRRASWELTGTSK
ncbi:MAG: hypothetical protein ABID54_07655 [Pseudomonadota bacterium]